MDSGELVLWKQQIERRVLEILGPWPHMLEMLVLQWWKKKSAKFCDIPANFRDKQFRFLGFYKKCGEPVFNPSLEVGSDISLNFLGDRLFHIFSQIDILTWKGRPKRVNNPRTPEMAKIAISQMFKSFPSRIFKK
jgi:hypothetical protein